MFVPTLKPADLPVVKAGAQRHCGVKTKEIGFQVHVFLRSSNWSLLRRMQSSGFVVDWLDRSAIQH